MIAHKSYVKCDDCGQPGELADDATQARRASRHEFVYRKQPSTLDVCRACNSRRATAFLAGDLGAFHRRPLDVVRRSLQLAENLTA